MKVRVNQGGKGRWRFQIVDDQGEFVAGSSVAGWKTEKEAMAEGRRVIQEDKIRMANGRYSTARAYAIALAVCASALAVALGYFMMGTQ